VEVGATAALREARKAVDMVLKRKGVPGEILEGGEPQTKVSRGGVDPIKREDKLVSLVVLTVS